MTGKDDIDKQDLYGLFLETFRRSEKFADDAARKASDLPYSSGGTNIRTENNYYGKRGGNGKGGGLKRAVRIGLVAASLAGGAGLAGVAGIGVYSGIVSAVADMMKQDGGDDKGQHTQDTDTGFEFLLLPKD